MTTQTKTDTTTATPHDTWEMASAILVALNQTHLKAQAEYQGSWKPPKATHLHGVCQPQAT